MLKTAKVILHIFAFLKCFGFLKSWALGAEFFLMEQGAVWAPRCYTQGMELLVVEAWHVVD